MCDRVIDISSIKQCETPLNTLFFSEFNMNLLQRGIRIKFRKETGIAIDDQDPSSLFAIMRSVLINNAADHYSRVNEQVRDMNEQVINIAFGQIKTGVTQYLTYVRDVDSLAMPIDLPLNTSSYGNKFGDANENIGY